MLMLLTSPVFLALLCYSDGNLESFEDSAPPADPVISALLRGEQLVPPPDLPPDAFIAPDVASVRQELAGASREWQLLDQEFRQRLLTVYALMARRGYQMALLEGYRSPERQERLARLGSSVTNARAYQSYHQYGLAADNAFLRDGRLVISERDAWAMAGYRLYGEIAESVGMTWGGRWRMLDYGHVELKKRDVMGRR
jgi:peptidoglycan L-alanyl-D-glutamate endopeptidase CwlK